MIYYCCANNLNIGDYFSMLGVKEAIGLSGEEEFMELRDEPFSDFISSLEENDILIVGGGGLFKDYFEKYWKDIIFHQKMRKFSLYLFGVGVCDIKNKSISTVISNEFINEIIMISNSSFIRAPLPIRNIKVVETCCPSVLYVQKNYSSEEIPSQEKLLYVNHRGLVGKEKSKQIRGILQKYCSNNNLTYSEVNNIAKNPDEIRDMMDEYISSKIIVTTRLHGYIIGRSVGKRVVAISNDYKIEGFADLIGDPVPLESHTLTEEILLEEIDKCKQIDLEKLSQMIEDINNKGYQIRGLINGN